MHRCTTVTMGLKSGIVGLPNVGKVRADCMPALYVMES